MRPEHSGKGESRGLETPSVVKEVKAGTSEITHLRWPQTGRQARGVVAGSALGLHLGPGGSHLPRPLQVQVSGRAGSEAGSGCCMQISTGRKPLLRRLPLGSESTPEKSLYFLKQKPPSFTRESATN